MKYLEMILNPITTWVLFGLIAICILFLMLFRKSLSKWLMWFYIPTMTIALTFMFVSFFADKLILSLLTENIREYRGLVSPFLGHITASFFTYGLVLFVLSVVAFVIHFFIKKQKIKNENI